MLIRLRKISIKKEKEIKIPVRKYYFRIGTKIIWSATVGYAIPFGKYFDKSARPRRKAAAA